ncbi:hypothetical protein CPT_Metamorpho_210 [Klebsiella phage Metamorpho]|nr:hypothetical protein CPT_Metamorpho_210 [Klebsiella phage Metamorpho]
MFSTLVSIHAYYEGQLNAARAEYKRGMEESVECLKGIQTLSQKTQNLILMDRKQVTLAEVLKSSKMLIEDGKNYQVKLLKRRVQQSPWFNSDFRSF